MMIIRNLLLGLFLFTQLFSYGQKANYNQRSAFLMGNSQWIIPSRDSSVRIDFNQRGQTGPIVTKTLMKANEGAAVVSDPVTGKLLFYSNGEQCWNANDAVMANGDTLLGNSRYRDTIGGRISLGTASVSKLSSMQGVCIVPLPGDSGKYYLFSLNGLSGNGGRRDSSRLGALYYSVVDMKLNNGLGDIVQGQKNIVLHRGFLSECMIGIPGNNCDIWLLVHGQGEENFFTYHITKDGIDTIPIISDAVTSITANYAMFLPYTYINSHLAVSPDRKKIALTAVLDIPVTITCEFDPETGKVFKPIEIGNMLMVQGQPCFSPDNSKLYFSNMDSVYQVNVAIHDSLSINSSIKPIGFNSFFDTVSRNPKYTFLESPADFRLYNDTVYFLYIYSRGQKPLPSNSYVRQYLGRINQPNLDGTACDFEENVIHLDLNYDAGYPWNSGFSNEVVYPLLDTFYNPTLDTTVCGAIELVLAPVAQYGNRIWNDGSTQESKVINEGGVYWIIQSDGCHSYVDTFIVKHLFSNPIITIDRRRLGTTEQYSTYQWMLDGKIIPNATGSFYDIPDGGNGDYQVIVNKGGCADTSDVYKVTNANETTIDDSPFLSDQIQVYPNPAKDIIYIQSDINVRILLTSIDGRVLKKEENITNFSVADVADGVYFLHVADNKNRLMKIIKITKTK